VGPGKQAVDVVGNHPYIIEKTKAPRTRGAFTDTSACLPANARLRTDCQRMNEVFPFPGFTVSNFGRFEDLVKNYKDMVFNLLFRLTGDYHLSQDLFQETFLKVYTGLESFESRSKISTWIYSIAVNTFRDDRKKRRWQLLKKNDHRTPDGEEQDHLTPEAQLIRKEEREGIQRRIRALKESLRVPLVLHYIEGLTIQQIAEITGRSGSDIKVSLHRARKKMKEGIENDRTVTG
jgi:RNA polymerase sigma-70 factor (ECF subfamily)